MFNGYYNALAHRWGAPSMPLCCVAIATSTHSQPHDRCVHLDRLNSSKPFGRDTRLGTIWYDFGFSPQESRKSVTALRVSRTRLGMRPGRAVGYGFEVPMIYALLRAALFSALALMSAVWPSQAASEAVKTTRAGGLEDTPLATVTTAVDAVISVLREKGGSRESRWTRISAIIEGSFDFQGMSRSVLAGEWRRATPEERRKFSDYFSQYIETTFRSRIEGYSDQRVEYISQRVRGDRATVETVMVSGKVRTPVTYKVRRSADAAPAGQWRAYDVVIEGVSLVANYRNTFAAIAKSEGMDGIIADVQRRIARHQRRASKSKTAN